MALIVQKFGGTSVGDMDRIRGVAARIKQTVEAGHQVAVAVSAMAGVTNDLVAKCRQASVLHDAREYDSVVAAGEQISAGLLAICLQEAGVAARSWLGWQIPVRTNDVHGAARIVAIDAAALRARIDEGQVPIVAGFQGIGPDGRITTLGRGGSDTSAVALAAALAADRCDIYTDVDGVYTTDPRITRAARKLSRITYEEMLEMASLGAKVLQVRSVALAMQHGVRLQVLSSFDDSDGTLIVPEDEIVERELISSVVADANQAQISVTGLSDEPGQMARLFSPLSDAAINVDMIVQSGPESGGRADVTFTVPETDLARAEQVLRQAQQVIGFHQMQASSRVVKVSVIGIGMRTHAGIAQRMFDALADKGINLHVISTSEIKISVLIDSEYRELAVRALHSAYGLDA